MGADLVRGPREPGRLGTWLMVADIAAKAVLLLVVVQVVIDPAWGNLEGKAPGTRAVTYPMLALLIPALHLARRLPGRYPWGADLLVTVPAFSDLLGNRLDLFDQVEWFDDFMHLVNVLFLTTAVLVLCGAAHAPLRHRLAIAIAWGMSLGMAWEVWEYLAFVTRSPEVGTAYADTVWDLGLGWVGAVAAALLVGLSGDREAAVDGDGLPRDVARRR